MLDHALVMGEDIDTAEIYVRAEPSEKLDALDAVAPPMLSKGRFRPPDRLMDLLRPKSRPRYADTQAVGPPR